MKSVKKNRDYKYATESEQHSSDQEEEEEEQMSTNQQPDSTTIENKSRTNRKNSTTNNSTKKQPKKRKSKKTKGQSNTTKSSLNLKNHNDLDNSYTTAKTIHNNQTSFKSSTTQAPKSTDSIEKELRNLLLDSFGYKIKEVDYLFIHDLMNDLVELHEIWDRIGFNKDTKVTRLDKFYQTLHDTVSGVMESEQELEEKILESIEQNKLQIKEMCIELHLKYDELKVFNQKNQLTVLEEDELLRVEHKRLQEQKKKRLDQFKQLSKIENELCSKLAMKRLDIRSIVPTEQELINLDKHIQELEKIFNERRTQMEDLKEEIVHLSEDLEMSRSDSFAELILFESVDSLSLSEDDINRAIAFRDDLKRKDNETLNEIRSLRVKIIELWSKLEIENLNLKPILLDTSNCDDVSNQWSLPNSMSKRTLVSELRKEYEHCVQVKTENMQKFIEKTRAEIKQYCEKMFFGQEEMKKLEQELFRQTNYNDDLLTMHEEKLDDLKFTYTEAESLFDKTQKWMDLWEKYMQFVETTKDPSRLTKRGYKMLDEEKQRKFFEKNLPKLEEELNHLASEFSNMNGGKLFTIHGSYYADYIQHIKNEFEESKKKEKLEKQIIRDNVRQNESRYGTKFVASTGAGSTPLRNKRPLNEKTPHEGKKKRTDNETTCINTPGSLMSNTRLATSSMATNKTAVPSAGTKTKLTLAKRKSKTPNAKRLMRKSRQLANAAAAAASNLAPPTNDSTILSTKSSNYDQADITIKSSNYSHNSISSNGNSRLPKLTISSSNNNTSTLSNGSNKYPPLSASSKYSSLNKNNSSTSSLHAFSSNRKMLQHMTSTASNTFIEEENIENLEAYPDSMNMTKRNDEKLTLLEVAAKMSKMITSTNTTNTSVASTSSGKYAYKYSEAKVAGSATNGKFDSLEVNYSDFSRNIKFGSDSTNKQNSQAILTSGRTGMSTRGTTSQSHDKLTSTLIKE